MAANLDDNLPTWNEVNTGREWSAILIGNGFSQNIWHRFGYSSIYETAASDLIADKLTDADQRLFHQMDTHNFEHVLHALSISKSVNSALEHETDFLAERYESIRHALINAVHYVHLPWLNMSEETTKAVADELALYPEFYSSNYDLMLYWAMMSQPANFKDFFWATDFDISNTEIRSKCTKAFFLHGGLHLYRKPSGQTLKRKASQYLNLLDLFATPFNDALPLFISEGTAREKLVSIYGSDYLSFAFVNFARQAGPLVIFGQSLGASDQHLIDVLRAKKGREIAISLRNSENVRERKAQLVAALPYADIMFFDAATHPLGLATLRVENPAA